MPILTNSNEPDLSDVGSFTAVPAIIRQLGPVEEPPAKGLHYRMGRQLRTGEAPLRQQSGPPRQVIINVGGLRFSMPWTTLDEGCPSERLGRLRSCSSHDDLMALCDDYDVACNEFFFDRHPAAFGAIAACLRAGKLRVSRGTCALAFREELAYWGVDEARLEWCCRRRLYQKQEEEAEAVKQLEEMETEEGQQGADKSDEMDDSGGPARTRAARRLSWLMSRLRDMVEDPSSGLPGKIFAFLSVIFVAITAVSLCISTMPDLRAEEDKGECSQKCHDIFVVETVCVAWFSFEFLLRLIQSRSKWCFLRDPLNIIDVAAILPYYVTLVVDSVSDGRPPSMGSTNIYLEKVGLVLRVLRALRILYVMRLARHSLGLQTLGLTIRRCTRELGLLLLFLCVAMALFAPMVYLAENELVMGSGGGGGGGGGGGASRASEAPPSEDSGIGGGGGGSRAHEFTSIPACYWWAIISMTTVGYGDMVPRSVAGQVVALSSILSGILLMAFPVTSIFHTFSRSYVELKEGQLRNLHLKHRVALLKAQATSPSLDSSQYSEHLGQHGGLIPSG